MQMIREQWKEIIHKRKLLITVIGLMFVPLFYSGIFLSAFWNPYGHTNQLKIAVVNQDVKTKISGKTVALGDTLTNKLKTNHKFHWVFLQSPRTAIHRLEEEDYYLVLIIPPDFSQNVRSLMNGKSSQIALTYYANSGKSYTASQMVKSIIPKIDQDIAREVTKSYVLALFSEINKASHEQIKGERKFAEGAKKTTALKKGSVELNKGLKRLAHSSLLFKSGLNQASHGSQKLSIGIQTLHTGLGTLDKKIAQLSSGQEKLTEGISKTATTSKTFHDHMVALNNGQQQLHQQLTTVIDQLIQLSRQQNVNQLNKQELAQLIKEQINASGGKNQFPVSAEDLVQWLDRIQSDPKAINGMVKLLSLYKESSARLAKGTQSLTKSSKDLSGALSQIQTGSQTIGTGINGIKRGSILLYSGSGKIVNGQQQLTDGLTILDHQQTRIDDGTEALLAGSNKMSKGIDALNHAINQYQPTLSKKLTLPDAINGGGENQAKQLANPEKSKVKDLHVVGNYGEGLSPYILSLGLFVGALTFAAFFPIKRPSITPVSGLSWFLSKYSVTVVISVFQALLICTLMLIGVRLQVTNIGLFYLFSIVSSIAFFSLVLFLGAAFGNIGKTIAGVLLLIQFGGSSGIFPVALTPTFFQVMHAYLPMTYSINGLREIIAIGTDPIYLTEQFMVLSGLVVGSALLAWLTFWFLMKKHRTTFVEEEISIK